MTIEVKSSPGKGLGLFATEDIPRGRRICFGPVRKGPRGSFDGTPVENHYWTEGDTDYLTFGPHSMCNHDDSPNCVSVMHNADDLLISIRPIRAGEELTLHYGDFTKDWDGVP